jgi:hypothetical protein
MAVFLAQRAGSDFQAWRDQRDWTARKYAALYITSLPEPERGAEHWRPAATLLRLIGENGGCVVFARLAVMYGLRKGVQPAPPEPHPS